MAVELTEALLSQAAGWEAMKRAREYLEQEQALSSNWSPPLLKGLVQSGELSYRAGLVIKGSVDIENICTCRESREWGKICAHSVAVGLHWLKIQKAGDVVDRPRTASDRIKAGTQARGIRRESGGEPARLFVILPPNFDQAVARGRIMVVFEAAWSAGRCPLVALPKDCPFAFTPQDAAVLDQLEALLPGETPGMVQLALKDFVSLLPALADHPNITLGKSS